MAFVQELKRRNVFRVAIAYLALAWLLSEVAGTLFPVFGIPDWGVRFVVVVLALGFVPALVFSWIYELTPEGIKREQDVVRDASITHLTARRLDLFTIGLIVVALALILADRLWLTPRFAGRLAPTAQALTDAAQTNETARPESQFPPNSIAVLPFVNMSDDAANEYFSDGISEELLNLMASIPDLRVTARTSSFSFKGKDVTIADIAGQLKVAHVLEGSVRKAGNRVRVTAQLIETASETHLWSETYDRALDDIFAIQDEIAAKVVGALKINLLGQAVPETPKADPEAYNLWLKCRYLASVGSGEALSSGKEYCRQSLDIDPDYAPAWVSLAVVYINLANGDFIDYEDGYEQAHDISVHALTLDPELWSAHTLLGWYAMMHERDMATAAKYYRTALELAPNNSAMMGQAASFAASLGRFERAIEFTNRKLMLEPLSAGAYSSSGYWHCLIGQYKEANEQFDKAAELQAFDLFMLSSLAKCNLLQHKPNEALAVSTRIENEMRRLWSSSMALYDLGQLEASDQALIKLIEVYPEEAASFIAEDYAWRGEIDLAFDWLNRAIEEKQYMPGDLVFDPTFSKLHADPRWVDIRARDGRSEEQLQKIDF